MILTQTALASSAARSADSIPGLSRPTAVNGRQLGGPEEHVSALINASEQPYLAEMITESVSKVRRDPIGRPILIGLVLQHIVVDHKVPTRVDSKEVIFPGATDRDCYEDLLNADGF